MSTPWSWSRGSRRQVDKVRWSQKVMGMGWGTDKRGKEKRKERERKEGRSYHDLTPLLCHYVSEWRSSSSMLRVVQGGRSRGGGGMWGVRVSEMEFLNYCWGMDLRMGKPHVV